MGGKRPDQHNIDPSEAGATDYKWRREGRSTGESIPAEEKQHLKSNPHGQPMIPESGINPAARALRERKAHRARGGESIEAGGPAEADLDERVDEASMESFPASDPPAQP